MHPLLFEIPLGSLGAIRVPAFGAFLALGFALGLALARRLAERAGLARERVLGAGLSALFAGVLGARLGFALLHHAELGSLAESISLRSGGLSGTVGLLFGVGLLAWGARRRGLPVATLLDAAAPSLAVALVLTRVGCWLEGCDAGALLGERAPHWLALLGTFPSGSPAWLDQVQAGGLLPTAAAALPVHPSELYESALGLVLLGLLLMARRSQRVAGTTALLSLVGYLVLRVVVDLTRAPSADAWCARLLLVAGVAFTARWRWRRA